MTRVKICGITNLEDALVSAKFGADALGFNFYAKSPRYIAPEKVREIIEQIPGNILKVGVFVNEGLEKIIKIAEIAGLDALQLHGEETPEFARELKAKTGLEIIKAFRVSPDFKPENVLRYDTDAVLLDAYNSKEHGGTGETFDWKIAFKVNQIVSKLYLAGGLDSQNVGLAIRRVQPFAVDSCSLLEKQRGRKDRKKVFKLISVVKDHNNFEVKDIYDLLLLIEIRPAIYLGKCSITLLRTYLDGFFAALQINGIDFDYRKFQSEDKRSYSIGFQSWVTKRILNKNEAALGWNSIILNECYGDEEKAIEYFFELLEEFKLEKEDFIKMNPNS